MFTDIVGFSRRMGTDEARMLRLLDVHNQLIHQTVAEHHGTVIKLMGDAFLVDFPSVVHAVQGARHIQAQFRVHNKAKDTAEQIHVRIGIHLGDIVQRNGDVFGDGVNIAARLQTLAEPDTICISDVVYRDVAKKLDLGTVVSLGRPKLKNIPERFEVYALLAEPSTGVRQTLRVHRLKLSRRVGFAHRILAGGLLTAGVLLLVWYLVLPTLRTQPSGLGTAAAPAALPLPDKPSLVVLPFTNMSTDPDQEYFSDGITEDITSDLSKISSLFVISRNSAFTYKGKAVKLPEVSRELGVQYVVEGSVRKSGDRLRITAQLIDATKDQHLWSERYDRPLTEIFALQDEIRQKIVTALRVKLTPDEQARFQRAPTNNLEAYDYYLRGTESFWRTTKEANARARQMFEQAIALDPYYASAYALQSLTYMLDWVWQWSQDRRHTLEQAFAAAQTAVALDDSLPLAHGVIGVVYQYKGQFEQAIAEGERAVALDPNDPGNYQRLASILGFAGRAEDAISMAKTAMRLNPRYPPQFLLTLGQGYHMAWHNDEAIATLKRLLVSYPNHMGAHVMLTCSYSDAGREEEARAQAAEILRVTPNFTVEAWRRNQFFRDPAELERHAHNLRKAGLK